MYGPWKRFSPLRNPGCCRRRRISIATDFRKISLLFSSHLHFERPIPIHIMVYDESRALANVLRLVGVPARQAADRRSICEPGRACRSSSRVRRNPARPGEERDGIHRWMMWLTLHGEDLSGMHRRLGSTQWDWASISFSRPVGPSKTLRTPAV